MDAFNYLSVMLSIILGLGLTQLFAGIGNLVQIRRRVKQLLAAYPLGVAAHRSARPHVVVVLGSAGRDHWTYATFVYVLVGPALLVIASHIIIPELLGERIDVQRHYFDTGPLFFGILAAAAVWAMLLEPVMGLRSFFVPFRLLQTIAVVAFGSCAASKNRFLHACAIALIAAILVASITIARTPFRQFELR